MSKILSSGLSILEASLSTADLERCPYPPNAIPGARDVSSSYGSTRLYEWGSEAGRKLLFVHGLSTPAPAVAALAMTLSQRGCRVMIIDLWGRGYSDTPSDLKHDDRLYTTQILIAIASSPVSWTGEGSGGFCIIGYSMGGGIAASFAAQMPHMVCNVVLMAPGGLYQSMPTGYNSLVLRYAWLFPNSYVREYIRRLLNGTAEDPYSPLPKHHALDCQPSVLGEDEKPPTDLLQTSGPLDVTSIVDWELDHHPGFVHTVLSALKYAPILKQDSTWRQLASCMRTTPTRQYSNTYNRLAGTRLLLLLGKNDNVLSDDFLPRVQDIFGTNILTIETLEGGHDFPVRLFGDVGGVIARFLALDGGDTDDLVVVKDAL